MTTTASSYFPHVVQLETFGVKPADGWPRFVCIGVTAGTDGTTWAVLQDREGIVYSRAVGSGTYERMRRINMSVDDFLASCKLED